MKTQIDLVNAVLLILETQISISCAKSVFSKPLYFPNIP
ncbi:hypothetical protein [Methylomonas albis]|nr:hypothetical protein [Methylomonas albis]